MPFILVNHDSFISDGPVVVKLQVDGFDDIGIGLDVGFLAVRPETDAAAVQKMSKTRHQKRPAETGGMIATGTQEDFRGVARLMLTDLQPGWHCRAAGSRAS